MAVREFAQIPKEFQTKDIHWAGLSPASSGTTRIFILLYRELSEPCFYDYWFENLEIALRWAKKYLGIQESDWRTKESLEQEGIQIIDEG